jgi:hypothetical protein
MVLVVAVALPCQTTAMIHPRYVIEEPITDNRYQQRENTLNTHQSKPPSFSYYQNTRTNTTANLYIEQGPAQSVVFIGGYWRWSSSVGRISRQSIPHSLSWFDVRFARHLDYGRDPALQYVGQVVQAFERASQTMAIPVSFEQFKTVGNWNGLAFNHYL